MASLAFFAHPDVHLHVVATALCAVGCELDDAKSRHPSGLPESAFQCVCLKLVNDHVEQFAIRRIAGEKDYRSGCFHRADILGNKTE